MKENRISECMLERYRLGELQPEDQWAVQEALTTDVALRSRLEALVESDRELRLHCISSFVGDPRTATKRRLPKPLPWQAMSAALLLAGFLIPVLYAVFAKPGHRPKAGPVVAIAPSEQTPLERAKGSTQSGAELSVYLKGSSESPLADQVVLQEGNTVQLAYAVPAIPEHYGVIFSIDGRSIVTMHYPYRRGQSSLLVSGRRVFLNEAYILDDAPDYEVFVLVVSGEPLNAEAVLREARVIAVQAETADPQTIEEKSRAVFADCAVEIVTVLKK